MKQDINALTDSGYKLRLIVTLIPSPLYIYGDDKSRHE